jgi:hypothetical protein
VWAFCLIARTRFFAKNLVFYINPKKEISKWQSSP